MCLLRNAVDALLQRGLAVMRCDND
jgi:hypothetical protein